MGKIIGEGITFDDVLLVPSYSEVIPNEVELNTHLTKKIKEDPRFEGLPVVIFSSLVNDEMKRKGEALGVDAQLSKPEIGRLVHQLDLLLK